MPPLEFRLKPIDADAIPRALPLAKETSAYPMAPAVC